MQTFKIFIVVLMSFALLNVSGQDANIASKVYAWKDIKMSKTKFGKKGTIISGASRDMESLIVEGFLFKKGKSIDQSILNADDEKLFIVKKGEINVKIGSISRSLVPGSVIVLLPDEPFQITNVSDEVSEIYIFQFNARAPVDKDRGIAEGGSFLSDWNDIEFKPHDKGGIRNYFNQPMSMIKRFEMHVTTLNGNIKSHEPHTHRAAEFVLMINGNTEMQIGDEFYRGSEGDLYFLGSDVSHAIRNVESTQCMYFAFQFE